MPESHVPPGQQDEEVGQVIVAEGTGVRFVVNRLIGEGGMGKVYEVTCQQTGELSALKTVRDDMALIRRFVDAFRRESHVWFILGKHRNIVQARSDPDARTYYNRALILKERQRYDEATNDYQAFVNLARPEDAEFVEKAGRKIAALRQQKQLIRPRQRATEAESHWQRAGSNAASDDFEGAVANLTKFLEMSEGHVGAGFYEFRGLCFQSLRDYRRVVADFTRAIELHSANTPGCYHNRALAYKALGNYEKAVVDLNNVIELDSGIPLAYAYNDRARCLEQLERYGEAMEDYKSFVKLLPSSDKDATLIKVANDRLVALREKEAKIGIMGILWNRFLKPK